jgi:hypothetical protein
MYYQRGTVVLLRIVGNYSSDRDLLPDTETDSDESIEIRLLRAEAYEVSGNYWVKAIEQCESAPAVKTRSSPCSLRVPGTRAATNRSNRNEVSSLERCKL